MKLLKGPIVILVVKILFLKVNIWHVNAKIKMPSIKFKVPKAGNSALLTQLHDTIKKPLMALTQIDETMCRGDPSQRILVLKDEWKNSEALERGKSGIQKMFSFFTNKKQERVNSYQPHKYKWGCCTGYVLSGTKCVPQCSQCQKGTCKKPNVCICNQGYRKANNNKGPCVPVCTNGCINGTCIDPEVCRCYKNYWLDSDGFTCKPICSTECERNYGYCSKPNVCTCHPGYKRIGNNSSPLCEPVCDRKCTNGRCAAPNVCMCANGYETDANDPFTCKPKCEPICSKPCKMGTCVAPESCSCNEGYEHRNNSSKYVCEPICKIGCGNNATCTAPGVCTCKEGFIYDETSRRCKTKPHCTKPCGETAECTGPDKCTCIKGYKTSVKYTWSKQEHPKTYLSKYHTSTPIFRFSCQPICNFVCINGRCTAPNVCTCSENFYPSWSESDYTSMSDHTLRICMRKSKCNSTSCGDNGICNKSSGICICNDGYLKDTNGDCVPFCNQTCSNGTCTAPNRCDCYGGFASRNKSFCKPICERGCQNGDCIGPNRCVCHDNFVPNIGHRSGPECIPVCSRNCSEHGICVMGNDNNYRCKCDFGWTGRDCDRPTMCLITMTYNQNNVNRITIRNDINNTIMRAQETVPYCECDKSLDNKTLCYIIPSESHTTFIGCFLNKDLSCYTTPRYSVSINDTKIVWPFVTIAILLVTGLITATAYIMYRKRQKKKLAIANPPANVFMRQFSTDELLLPNHNN